MVFLLAGYSEIFYGKRLYYQLSVFTLREESRDTFVNGAPYREFERGVESIHHISEILMAHKLYKCSRNLRHSRLYI